MKRKLVVIGNGVGMALCPEKFDLKRVMPSVWKSFCCSEDDKAERELIAHCLKGVDREKGPTQESQLMSAQIAQLGHELISNSVVQNKLGDWFQNKALNYQSTIAKYIYNVASALNENSKEFQSDEKFRQFIEGLIPFLGETRSHFATLNYDTLFYSAFNDAQNIKSKHYRICHGYVKKTCLNDGYRKTGFDETHFDRKGEEDFGYYLHLHGSPLIVDQKGAPTKLKRSELEDHIPTSARHIILSDGALKPFLIERSEVLRLYWRMLSKAIDEVSEIIIFGYGGFDDHLNQLIMDKAEKKNKYVIEWSGAKHYSDGDDVLEGREISADSYWENRLGPNTFIKRSDDILEFRSWDDPGSFVPF